MKIKEIIICILAALAISDCDTNKEPYVYPTEYEFEYAVTGTSSSANITYQDLRGNYVELTNVDITLGWNYQTHYYDSMVLAKTPVYLSAQSLDPSPANVTVTINAKGAPYKTDTSATEFGFAIVYGTLP